MNLKILLVEDDEIEKLKFERALKKLEANHSVVKAANGEEALTICKDVLPNLILLDLNMPKMNGLEFLDILRADENLKFVPTVVFSTSNNHQDMINAYKVGIAGYVVKPLHYSDYVNQIEKIIDYWSINELVSL
ncbi:Response regulator receiver domain-containing protein [Tenacibaculum sp. MAR_2009_124]|uniref:response regulator n=1 Tax=Tenacibaculum sp. MAR_2009_124 TaxID=1250059 RepID=UPI0008954CB5|nr:response regulator [Tenacibaculum sp. MAR_2009_124]SEB50565.1 Response regulator receiver domain-containing protein [Tenacibaculum sp. MAR_2009_124]